MAAAEAERRKDLRRVALEKRRAKVCFLSAGTVYRPGGQRSTVGRANFAFLSMRFDPTLLGDSHRQYC